MDYKKHTKERFIERFIQSKSKINLVDFSDNDYYNLCAICNSSNVYKKVKSINGSTKMIIEYSGIFMWCIISKKSKIVKTVYPISKKDYIILKNKN